MLHKQENDVQSTVYHDLLLPSLLQLCAGRSKAEKKKIIIIILCMIVINFLVIAIIDLYIKLIKSLLCR